MTAVRTLLAQRELALLICAAALLLKLLVPAGWMIDAGQGRFAVVLCPAAGPVPEAAGGHSGITHRAAPAVHAAHGTSHAAAVPNASEPAALAQDMAGHGGSGHDGHGNGKPELPCDFAGLSAAALGAIDPLLLAGLIAFIVAIGLAGVPLPLPSRTSWLRPPLRGPPATC